MEWIKKAIVLGLVFYIAVLLVKPVGVSTQYSVLSGIIHKTIRPGIIWQDDKNESGYASSNRYYNKSEGKIAKAIKKPWNYDFIFVLSIPLGAYLGTMFYKKKNNQDEHCEVENKSKLRIYGPSFIAGFLILFGARMADGCTSGHMMSGMMQGSISGYIFAACVFAIAIPTAILVGKLE